MRWPMRQKAMATAIDKADGRVSNVTLLEDRQRHPLWEAICGFTPAWLQPWMATLTEVYPLLNEAARDETDGYDPVGAIAEAIDASRVANRHPLDIAQYTWIKTMLDGQILSWGGSGRHDACSRDAPRILGSSTRGIDPQLPA